MAQPIPSLVDALRTRTEGLLGAIVRDADREELQQAALSIYATVIELRKELEQFGTAPPASQTVPAHDQSIAEEVSKVSRKLPKWAANQQQINARILTRFLQLRRNGVSQITEREFAAHYGDQAEFFRSYPQMKTMSPKNNGKVFELRNGFVEIWPPVRGAVEAYEKTVFGS